MQKEIELVGEIQKSLLSANQKQPFPIAGINIPAKVVSGDFYNFIDLKMDDMDLPWPMCLEKELNHPCLCQKHPVCIGV